MTYFCVQEHVCVGTGVTAHRPSRSFRFTADRELIGQQFLHPTFVHNQHEDVCRRASDLQSVTSAFDSDRGRGAKAARGIATARDETSPVLKAPFFTPGIIMTQRDLSNRSRGIPLSGSCITSRNASTEFCKRLSGDDFQLLRVCRCGCCEKHWDNGRGGNPTKCPSTIHDFST